MRKYCPECGIWIPEDLDRCPVCQGKPKTKTTRMEKIFLALVALVIILVALSVIFPQQMFRFIEAVDLDFVEIGNDSSALLRKLDLENDSIALQDWEQEQRELIRSNLNSSPVRQLVEKKTDGGNDPYLERIDSLSAFVTNNIKYKESNNFTDVEKIMSKFSGNDLSHVILLASIFNEAKVDFKIDIVESEEEERGFHYRILVGTTKSEEELRDIIVNRIKKTRLGLTGTKEKAWYVKGNEYRWYLLDTTSTSIKGSEALMEATHVFIGSSHPYYANRSHYSFDLGVD